MAPARQCNRSEFPLTLRPAAQEFEAHYDTRFEHLLEFDSDQLATLHADGVRPPNISVASDHNDAIAPLMSEITRIANLAEQTPSDQRRYLEILLEIYSALTADARSTANTVGAVLLAPEREGRILAEHLGCNLEGDSWTPQAKRIGSAAGLAVLVDGGIPTAENRNFVIVDGVVASGVTLMALLQLAAAPGSVVQIFTCHATLAGTLAIDRFARSLGVELRMYIGHVSGALNEHFYAVENGSPDRLVLGDIGDTISSVGSSS